MKRLLILASVAVLAIGAIGTASAHDDQNGQKGSKAGLGGFAEVPSVSTTGSGKLQISLDNAGTTLTFSLTYKDLQGAVSWVDLNFGQASANGGQIAFLCGGGGKPACPASPTATAITGTIVAGNILGPATQGIAGPADWAEVLRAIRNGTVYANVHTSLFPAGEIRGQLRGGWGEH